MIRLLFAIAVGSFVLSLPIHMTGLGASLRRVAGVCFVLALLPALLCGLFLPGGVEAHPFAVAMMLVIVVVAAYAVIRFRAAVAGGSKSNSLRIREKTPLDRTRRREQDFFAFITDRQEPPEEWMRNLVDWFLARQEPENAKRAIAAMKALHGQDAVSPRDAHRRALQELNGPDPVLAGYLATVVTNCESASRTRVVIATPAEARALGRHGRFSIRCSSASSCRSMAAASTPKFSTRKARPLSASQACGWRAPRRRRPRFLGSCA